MKKKFGAANVELDIAVQPDLLGGFILRCGDCEYDRSVKGKLDKLQQKLQKYLKIIDDKYVITMPRVTAFIYWKK